MRPIHSLVVAPLLVVAAMVSACNGLTGIGDLRVVADSGQGGAGGSGAVTSGGQTSGSNGASGPATAAGAGGATGATSGVTSGSGPVTSAATTTAASTTAASGGASCMYPGGPTGVSQGSTVSGNLTWQGYPDGSNQLSTISIHDYFDCDGSKGINAVLILQSATWCGACQQEAQEMPSTIAGWSGLGIKVLTLMIEDVNSNPATPPVAQAWKSQFNLPNAVAADPDFSFAHPGTNGLPLNILVDPRTMKIVSTEEGYSGDYSAVTQLAMQNK